MKGRIYFFLALLVSGAEVQAEGYYEVLRYRANDPFVFCTQGQINEDKCWRPLPPYTGAYMMMPHCNPPNQYGKPWTQADYDSLAQYLSVCPQAKTSGGWEGRGLPEQTPFSH